MAQLTKVVRSYFMKMSPAETRDSTSFDKSTILNFFVSILERNFLLHLTSFVLHGNEV